MIVMLLLISGVSAKRVGAVAPDTRLYSGKIEERASVYATKADLLAKQLARTKNDNQHQNLLLQKELLAKLEELPEAADKRSLDSLFEEDSGEEPLTWEKFEKYVARYVNLIKEAKTAKQNFENTDKQMQSLHTKLIALAENSSEEDILQLQHAFQVRKFSLQSEIDKHLGHGLEKAKEQFSHIINRVTINGQDFDEQLKRGLETENKLKNLEAKKTQEATEFEVRLEQQESLLAGYIGQDLSERELKVMHYEQLKLLDLQADHLFNESRLYEAQLNHLEEEQKVLWFRLFDNDRKLYDLAGFSEEIDKQVALLVKKTAKAQVRKYIYEKELSSLRGGNALIGPKALELSEKLNERLSENFTLLSGVSQRAEVLQNKGILLSHGIDLKQSTLGSMVTKTRMVTDNLYEKIMEVLKYPLLSYSGMSLSLLLVIQILVLLFLGIVINRLYGYAVFRMGRKRKWSERTIHLVHAIGKYPFIFMFAMIILSVVGVNTRSLALVAGALSVGIGFGMQTIVSNLVSGIILLFDKSIRPGDFISLGEYSQTGGYRGNVVQMNIRATVLRTNDNINIIVPNADLMASQVVNWTYSDERIRFRVPFSVTHEADIDQVKEVVKNAVLDLSVVLSLPEPQIWLAEQAEGSLAFLAAIWVEGQNARKPAHTFDIVLTTIHKALGKHDIQIPFPHMNLSFHNAKKQKTRLPQNADILPRKFFEEVYAE